MTRATLLHVLDNTSALGPVEVRELEQLAQAFPYCQTAHLLLAKAAHDQGTMLAGQRLRRAATYAADRTLLRRLIEEVEPAKPEEVELPTVANPPTEAPTTPEAVASVAPVETAVEPPAAPVAVVPPIVVAEPELVVEPTVSAPIEEAVEAIAEPEPVDEPVIESVVTPVEAPVNPAPPVEELPAEVAVPVLSEADAALLLDVEGVNIPASEPTPEFIPEAEVQPEPKIEEDLPAQAPAIRPPVEVGEARFEFGLAEPPPPAVPTYELPGLVDEWAASAVTRSLGSLESLLEIPPAAGAAPAAAVAYTPAAFTGDDAVGYAFGESSRLGYSMQLLNLLTDKAEADAAASAQAAAQPPASPLPPVGTFFEPDPLLLDYWATHSPPAPVVPSSLDLINNFLRRQPRLTRPAMLPPAASAQADLSIRSTRAELDLASESLARILVRQGKTARAIEIYEKLMVKQPEKMAYFASQIQQLQPPA
ncbi:hypothetical protein Q3A66_16155 [Hymenobacter sp. BT770]|uniref:hypothetical protein n=1 Tax=Hymenobacter sp. BT770 TaxID=2886942 RepID=UPI001D1074AA|nr:hypothetical protein [Hymenobacter sp. BT770]MCC3154549.1 hypothetical protein [Hymenobacter sp. BT770]MDO3416603.1 hypothetical protein [Hymenobacter sp. BT770]